MIVSDHAIRKVIEEKMKGNLILNGDETEASIIEDYFNGPHHNFTIDTIISGFLCASVYDSYVVINFAWYDGSYKSRKSMVKLGKYLYKVFTVIQKKPIYYSGKKNMYSNHSKKLAENVWEFIV